MKLLMTAFLLFSSCINPQEAKNKGEIVKAMAKAIAKKYGDAPQMTIEEFQKIPQKDAVILVDVRGPEERAVSTIAGAINREVFENKLQENPQDLAGKTIVSFCTIGERSSKYTRELKKRDLNAFNLQESILGWSQRQLPLVDSQGKETRKVHVYGEAWNLIPKNYQGVWE